MAPSPTPPPGRPRAAQEEKEGRMSSPQPLPISSFGPVAANFSKSRQNSDAISSRSSTAQRGRPGRQNSSFSSNGGARFRERGGSRFQDFTPARLGTSRASMPTPPHARLLSSGDVDPRSFVTPQMRPAELRGQHLNTPSSNKGVGKH